MTKHLSDKDIDNVIILIDAWENDSRLTWDKLCVETESRLGLPHKRQAFDNHQRISDAYKRKRNSIKGKKQPKKTPPSLAIAGKSIEKLEAQVKRLTRENSQLLIQFKVWQYNAYAHGMKQHQLNRPLPEKK